MMDSLHEATVEFGPFALCAAARTLTYCGEDVALKPKEVELLVVLATLYPSTVSKDEIIARLWREGVASDAALSQTVYRLRRTLASYDADFQYIRTIPGWGFRLAKPSMSRVAC